MASKRKAATAPTAATKEPPTIEEEIQRLLDGLAQRGVYVNLNAVDMGNMRAAIHATAAQRILIEKGLCTPEEANVAVSAVAKEMLAGLLQAIEEAQLKAAKTIQRVDRPPIQLARLRD